jgi:lipopolysaccharide export LptBFGC system permease protein LptF
MRSDERLRRVASHFCSDDTRRRFVDPVIADLQFERAEAFARNDRWRARLAAMRAVLALTRVLLVADRDAWHVAGWALAATGALTALTWLLPLFAFATGAYEMPASAANLALLLVYLTPVALPVVMPVGVAFGVLAACDSPSDARRTRAAVIALALVATAVACLLFVWVAPVASAAFRDLARPIGRELRINVPGSIGYRLEQQQRWTLLAATAVLAAFASSAASAARRPRREWLIGAAGVASFAFPFLSIPCGLFAVAGILPVPLAAWLPNIVFATAAVMFALST